MSRPTSCPAVSVSNDQNPCTERNVRMTRKRAREEERQKEEAKKVMDQFGQGGLADQVKTRWVDPNSLRPIRDLGKDDSCYHPTEPTYTPTEPAYTPIEPLWG